MSTAATLRARPLGSPPRPCGPSTRSEPGRSCDGAREPTPLSPLEEVLMSPLRRRTVLPAVVAALGGAAVTVVATVATAPVALAAPVPVADYQQVQLAVGAAEL